MKVFITKNRKYAIDFDTIVSFSTYKYMTGVRIEMYRQDVKGIDTVFIEHWKDTIDREKPIVTYQYEVAP